jgi:hypothetical protein
MAMNILKHRELRSLAHQGRRGNGRFVDVVAHRPEPTPFLSPAAARLADKTGPYSSCVWFADAMNQGNLRTGRSAA